jgi:hypothetical protein
VLIYCISQATIFLLYLQDLYIYFTLVHSHQMYYPIIMSCTSNTNINRIFKLQRKAIRILTKSNYSTHTQELSKAYNIPPYELLLNQAKLLLLFKLFIGFVVTYINMTFTLHSIMIHLYITFILSIH